jgi:hypothetical protein
MNDDDIDDDVKEAYRVSKKIGRFLNREGVPLHIGLNAIGCYLWDASARIQFDGDLYTAALWLSNQYKETAEACLRDEAKK